MFNLKKPDLKIRKNQKISEYNVTKLDLLSKVGISLAFRF